ncbi:unnamed protein product [Rotaria socialis]|uniref:DUF4139 domain-containing protein n=1 Tax=Rotaria socialis TaxID=392032 RepID=A0A820XJ16_9BILA|nr:unnamed protein product [Rotaria socialis]CAF4533815.1 unnamed protein product [Rotaria socialis]
MTTNNTKTPTHASNVYLFKNGYGMIVKTFEFPPTEGNHSKSIELLDPPSNPVHGTFWIQSLSNNTSISAIRTKKTHTFVDKDCCSVEDLLKVNIGQDIQLLVRNDGSKSTEWISGKIKSVKQNQLISDDEDNDTEVVQGRGIGGIQNFQGHATQISASPLTTSSSLPCIQQSNFILLETTDNDLMALPKSSIQSIRGASLTTTYQRKVFKNCLSIDYKNQSESSDAGLMKYLTYGITWAPSYNLILLSSQDPSLKRLRLSSKAVILNDIENMNVDNLFCIVGFPNVSKFASVTDPIISGDDVKTFLERLQQCEIESARPNYNSFANVASNSVRMQQMVMPMSSSTSQVPDDSQQDTHVDDLHLYEFKNILLQKKERLMLPIFDIEIPYRDVYHCKIGTAKSTNDYYGYENKNDFEEVWHSVEFDNVSDFVWTTAPIVITKGQLEQQFIGQDKLTYTLKGSTTFVNLTKALDVRIQLDEKVSSANSSRFVLSRVNYQTDQIEGKILVMNYKSEEVVVVINTILVGKMSNYSIAPKKDAVKTDGDVANQRHDIRWEITVKPKQTLEIKYVRSFNKRI